MSAVPILDEHGKSVGTAELRPSIFEADVNGPLLHQAVVRELAGGGVRVAIDVCLDRALHGWILSFGPFARVVSPERLARDIAKQIEEARALYI